MSENLVPVPPEFASKSRIGSMEKYRALYDRSIQEPDAFWAEQERAERGGWLCTGVTCFTVVGRRSA